MSNPSPSPAPPNAPEELSAASHLEALLKKAVLTEASDIHLRAGHPPRVRQHGAIRTLPGFVPSSANDTASIAARILYQARRLEKQQILTMVRELQDEDCSFSIKGARFRVNICRQRGSIDLVLRVVPDKIPDLDSLSLPPILKEIATEQRGLVLVTGATGSGKSTTLAAMMHHVNANREKKIVTIEDPIEYLHNDIKSAVTQREVGSDTESFRKALRASLRQDPDVIMVGEMRDRETIDTALKAAETGHLVFSTLHTADSEKTITRIVSMYDQSEQRMAQLRLSESLKAVIAQRLLPRIDGKGRIAAMEILRVTLAIQAIIADPEKGGMLDAISRGAQYGMQTFDQHLMKLYKSGLLRLETAKMAATSPNDFERNLSFV